VDPEGDIIIEFDEEMSPDEITSAIAEQILNYKRQHGGARAPPPVTCMLSAWCLPAAAETWLSCSIAPAAYGIPVQDGGQIGGGKVQPKGGCDANAQVGRA
jgi:hypothetical protein